MQMCGFCPARWVQLDREAVPRLAAATLFILTGLGLLTQAVYASWLHWVDPCDDDLYSQACGDKLHFFGTAKAEVAATVATVALSLGLSLVYIVHQIRLRLPPMLRSCRALVSRIDLGHAARELWRGVLRKARMLFAAREKGPDFERIQREFEVQRLRRTSTMVHIGCPFFVGFQLYIVYQSYLKKLSWESVQDPVRVIYWSFFFGSGGIPLLALLAIAVPLHIFPSLVHSLVVDSANVLLSSAWAWKLAVSSSPAYPFQNHWLTVSRLIQVFYLGNAKLSIALNAMILSVNVVNLLVRPPGASPTDWTIYRELLVFLGTASLLVALERSQWDEARNVVRVKKSDRSRALVKQLLANVCDAVPQLDSNLCLAEPCPSLSTLLFRGGPIPKGARFADLLSPDDTEHFNSCIARSPPKENALEASGPASDAEAFTGLFHVRFRVANNQLLPASVYFSCIPDLDGLPTFLLGICEDHNPQVVEMQAPVVPGPALPGPAAAAMLAQVDMPARLPEDAATNINDRTSETWSSEGDHNEGEEVLTVWVDSMHDDLPVLGCSPSFALVGGVRGPCARLAEWMTPSAKSRVCSMIDVAKWPSDDPCRVGKVHVQLSPPNRAAYKCSVTVVPTHPLAPALETARDPSTRPVCLAFKVKQVATGAHSQRNSERKMAAQSCRQAASRGSLSPSRITHEAGAPSNAAEAARAILERAASKDSLAL